MFNVLYPNRWFIWAVVACLVVGVFVWWQIELYSLDQELASQWAQEPHRKISPPLTLTNHKYHNDDIILGDGSIGPPVTFLVPTDVPMSILERATNRVVLSKPGDNGYVLAISLKPNSQSIALRDWIIANPFGSADGGRSKRLVETQLAGLNGLELTTDDDLGPSLTLWLDDSINRRVITLSAGPLGGEQIDRFQQNMAEVRTLITNLRI